MSDPDPGKTREAALQLVTEIQKGAEPRLAGANAPAVLAELVLLAWDEVDPRLVAAGLGLATKFRLPRIGLCFEAVQDAHALVLSANGEGIRYEDAVVRCDATLIALAKAIVETRRDAHLETSLLSLAANLMSVAAERQDLAALGRMFPVLDVLVAADAGRLTHVALLHAMEHVVHVPIEVNITHFERAAEAILATSDLNPKAAVALSEKLSTRAVEAYYSAKNREVARKIADAAFLLDQTNGGARAMASICALGDKDWARAEVLLKPGEGFSPTPRQELNYATALRGQNRRQEAMDVTRRVMEQIPDEDFALAQFVALSVDLDPRVSEEAERAFWRLCEQAVDDADATLETASPTKFALDSLRIIWGALSDSDQSERGSNILIRASQIASPVLTALALRFAYDAQLPWVTAQDVLRATLAIGENEAVRFDLVDVLLDEGDPDQAIIELDVLVASQVRDVDRLRALLQRLRATSGVDEAALLALEGDICWRSQLPAKADALYAKSFALAKLPHAKQIHWALCRVMQSVPLANERGTLEDSKRLAGSRPVTEEEWAAEFEWSRTRSVGSVMQALAALASIARDEPNERDAADVHQIARTLADLTSNDVQMFSAALHYGMDAYGEDLVDIERILELLSGTAASSEDRQWQSAYDKAVEASAIASRLGWPRLAAACELRAADVVLRLDRFGDALAHAKSAFNLNASPLVLTPRLIEETGAPQRGAVVVEFEYIYLVGLSSSLMRTSALLSATALMRLGLVDRAIDELGADWRAAIDQQGDNARALATLGTIYLAAKRPEPVAEVCRRLESSGDSRIADDFLFRAAGLREDRAELRRIADRVVAALAEDDAPDWRATWLLRAIELEPDLAKKNLHYEHIRETDLAVALSPSRRAMAATTLADLHLANGNLQGALDMARGIVTGMESVREDADSLDTRRGWGNVYFDTYGKAIEIAFEAGAATDALIWSEHLKSRLLVEEIFRRKLQDRGVGAAPRQSSASKRALAAALRAIIAAAPTAPPAQLVTWVADCALKHPDEAGLLGEPMQLVRDTHFVGRLETAAATLERDAKAFDEVFERELTATLAQEQLDLRPDDLQRLIAEAGANAGKAITLVSFFEIGHLLLVFFVTANGVDAIKIDAWSGAEHQRVARALTTACATADYVVVAPHGSLVGQAIHTWSDGAQCLLDAKPVAYCPNLAILHSVLAKSSEVGTSLVVADPTETLFCAPLEGEDVARLLACEIVKGADASNIDLVQKLSGPIKIFHYCGHVDGPGEDPLDWGPVLSLGDDAKPRKIVSARVLASADLRIENAVISACRSGAVRAEQGGELYGLARTLLAGGARSLVATLYPVNDLASYLFMISYYREWIELGRPRIEALRTAALELRGLSEKVLNERLKALEKTFSRQQRDQSRGFGFPFLKVSEKFPYADPLHWGAFILMGDWSHDHALVLAAGSVGKA